MATLVLQVAGSALGSMIGGPVGGMIGRAIGAVAGAAIDSAVLNSHARPIDGPRLTEMPGLASTEGAPIPRLYGRARIGGQIIWSTRFEEVISLRRERGGSSGGKGALGGGQRVRRYEYFANFAVGLCEGEIAFVRRIWADGKLLDLTQLTTRLYTGDETQMPDALIVAKEGAENAPAYRGLAYMVFERMPLADYGNRIPQLSFEIVRPVGRLPQRIRAINLIPGAGEFAYATEPVYRTGVAAGQSAENRSQLSHTSDFEASIAQLAALCPALESVTLIIAWFGDDLRCDQCSIRPKIDLAEKATHPAQWSVSGLDRTTATLVSFHDGKAAYGGTPSDSAVRQAILALKARGLKVNVHPFLMMDIPAANARPDPWTGGAAQPAYPWRGDLTVNPAPGRPGTADKIAAAATQIAAFFGTAQPTHFQPAGDAIIYSGPAEWSLRRFVLHYAALAALAGGVDGFILGSELRSLTRVRDEAGQFPAVNALVTLANDVRSIIGSTPVVTYGADWTEYGAVTPEAGTVCFPLDGLWSAPAISCVGIDWYPPLSDWRDGDGHLDRALADNAADPDYLRARMGAGEAYEWFYADAAARAAQSRIPITDGAYGKPWVYRPKDILGWWANPHVPRLGGVETAATAWVPQSKPVWLLEAGCPAVDRGGNAPNVFPDEKSSAASLPYFSRGFRDDVVQARVNSAVLDYFDATLSGGAARNPVSALYGGRMLDLARVHFWAWDARPFPAFPDRADLWGDAPNFEHGHWLNGRLEGAPLDEMLTAMAADFGIADLAATPMNHFIDGYVVERTMSLRAALEPLADMFGFGLSRGSLRLTSPSAEPVAVIGSDDCLPNRDGVTFDFRRAQETELPGELTFGFSEAEADYRRVTAMAHHLAGNARRQTAVDTALVARRGAMQRRAEIRLKEIWTARESVAFSLPPSRIALDPGDTISLAGSSSLYVIRSIRDGEMREIEAHAIDPAVHDFPALDIAATPPVNRIVIPGVPQVEILDLPMTRGEPAALVYAGANAAAWPGAMIVWRRSGETEFQPVDLLAAPAVMGLLLDSLPSGPVWRWDRQASVRVALTGGTVASLDEKDALAGGNLFAVKKNDGQWELLIAKNAVLESAGVWRLSGLLRGLGNSEAQVASPANSGARILKIDAGVTPVTDSLADIGQSVTWRVGPSGVDHADPRVVEITRAVTALALQPLPPVHVQARREAGGVTLRWIRQTRGEGDNWELAEVPLAESREAYDIEIRGGGGTLLRSLNASQPSVLYAAADELADFGSPQTAIDVTIYQMSDVAGRGAPRRLVCPVTG